VKLIQRMINKMPCLKSHASQRAVWGVGREMVKKDQHVAKKFGSGSTTF
jgi:hypothetical protein